ncbi:MAG: glycosyltransferase family 39 protein, partial [Chloroflexota bacterium]
MKVEPSQRPWPFFFWMSAIEGAVAMAALLSIPSEGGMFGFSPARLALTLILLGMAVFWMLLALNALRFTAQPAALASPRSIGLAALSTLTFGLLLFLPAYLAAPERFLPSLQVSWSLLPYAQRAWPVLAYLFVLSAQTFLFLLILKNGFHPRNLAAHKPTCLSALIALLLLLSVFLLISLTRLGLTPDPAYWGEPGIPVQGWQLVLALLGGTLVFVFFRQKDEGRARFLLPALLYVLAVTIWLLVPLEVMRNSFYVSMDPPTYQPFPYSDAGYYDSMAQSLFIGHPYQGEIPTRPLYILLLAFLHLLFGQRFDLVLAGQAFVFAFIPVIFYLLGQKLHSRAAGVTAALLFIFREWITLLVSSATRVSNSKTMLVDLPTLLLVSLACLFVLRWLERRDAKSALVAGGSFGLLLLLRTQSMLLLPVILFMAALVFGLRRRPFYYLSAFFMLGLFLAVAPWLTHNYLDSGQVTFDAPFQYKVIASQYAYTGNLDIDNVDLEGKGVGGILIQFLLKDPGFVFGFIANHFLAGWVGGLLALPLSGIFSPATSYWAGWDGSLAWYNLALVLLYLAVIALGLGSAWRRGRWLGLLPLAFNVGYSAATAVGRFSGWRYDLPADWVPYFYFALGFAELLVIAATLLGAKLQSAYSLHPSVPISEFRGRDILPVALLFVFIGSLPSIA